MLVLSRKKGEKIVVNDNIVVTVVEVRGDKVRIGIEAPLEVLITRPDAKNQSAQGMQKTDDLVPV